MARAIGSLARVVYGEETVYGAPPSPFTSYAITSHTYGGSASGTKEELVSDVITGERARAPSATVTGNKSSALSIPFNLSINGLPRLLKHAIGKDVQTSGTGPYTHIIKKAQLPIGMHMEYQYQDIGQYISYGGVKVNTLSMNLANSGLIAGTLECMGKGSAPIAQATITDTVVVPDHKPIHHKSATTVEEGGAAVDIVGFEWSNANNLDDTDYILGDAEKKSLDEGMSDVTGTITYRFENETYYNKWLNDTTSSLKVVLTWTPSTELITFEFPNITYTGEVGVGVPTAQGITVAMPFRANKDTSTATDVQITVVNSEPTI